MKKYHITLILLLVLTSCTKNFDKYNTDPTEQEAMDSKYIFSGILKNGTYNTKGSFQLIQSLYTIQYAQYWANTTNDFPTDRYTMNDQWLESTWNDTYTKYIKELNDIISNKNEDNNRIQIARIFKVFIFHRVTDIWGEVPYFEATNDDIRNPKYDQQKDIYLDMLEQLNDAISKLTPTNSKGYGDSDLLYQGNSDQWKKFGASLMLRLAMHIRFVEPALAKQYGEKAIQIGTFDSNTDSAILPCDANTGNGKNPIHDIAYWNEFRMSKTMEEYLNGTRLGIVDPRLRMYWSPAGKRKNTKDEFAVENFIGVYNGLPANQATQDIENASNIGPIGSIYTYDSEHFQNNPEIKGGDLSVYLMTFSEVCFLKAEASLIGWNTTGAPKEFYQKGIEASMTQWSVRNPAYQGPIPTSEEISTYIKTVSTLVDQEAISTQKWIAMFPDGFEGWTEVRRTGFPELIPIISPDPSSGISKNEFIQRIDYPIIESDLNPNSYNSNVSLKQKMWWSK